MYVRLAQLDRAFGYGPKGRGFESSSTRIKKVRFHLLMKMNFFKLLNKFLTISVNKLV